MTSPLQTVHVRVNDAATGKPTPARVRFTDSAGNYHAPFGRLATFATGRGKDVGGNLLLGRKEFAYIDGGCEIALPPGQLHVEIHKGPEYIPVNEEVLLTAGKLSLRFALQRWSDMRRDGWHAGDCRAHFLSPFAALLEGRAEDLAIVHLLAHEHTVDGVPAVANLLAFSGQQHALAGPDCLVTVNTLNVHAVLGSLGLLHCHRIVFPLGFGGPAGQDDWTLADWCDQCHRKQGLVIWARTRHQAGGLASGEPLADLILGKIDAFELEPGDYLSGGDAAGGDSAGAVLHDWYDLLNAGIRVPLVGSSGKESNTCQLGSMRTYARLAPGDEFSGKSWIEAVRRGATFITNGPLLSLTANGHDPGQIVDLPAHGELLVRVEARSVAAFDHLELVQNGTVIAQATPSGSPGSATLELRLPAEESQWLAARCRGTQQLFAHTSALHVRIAGKPAQRVPAALARLTTSLERLNDWARSKARCDDRQRARLTGIFEEALRTLVR
ncbi:MAG: hypothetical protein FJ271_20390 [Planctomycetes bacterium]|nr:hypothetical protein [Planctomycetota bacterium]